MAYEDVAQAQKAAQKYATKPKNDGDEMDYVLIGAPQLIAGEGKFSAGKQVSAFPVEYEGSEGVKQLTFTVGTRVITELLKVKVGKTFRLIRSGTGADTRWKVTQL